MIVQIIDTCRTFLSPTAGRQISVGALSSGDMMCGLSRSGSRKECRTKNNEQEQRGYHQTTAVHERIPSDSCLFTLGVVLDQHKFLLYIHHEREKTRVTLLTTHARRC